MTNIYIWFETESERRNFTQNLIELKWKKGTNKKDNNYINNSRRSILEMMELGKTSSPYYCLYKKFYNGDIPKCKYKYTPYHIIEVFKNGFRSIYYQNSYWSRPGKWLVIQLRDTKIAYSVRKWIFKQIPIEKIGKNVAIPKKTLVKKEIKQIDKSISKIENTNLYNKTERKRLLNRNKRLLENILKSKFEVFKNENIYLWERLGYEFYYLADLKNMEECLRVQAKLQPGNASPFLNMGVFFDNYGFTKKAIEVYLEGIQVDPSDNYVYYNLTSLLCGQGYFKYASKIINKAIRINPSGSINYKLKGDLYFSKKDYKKAVLCYDKAFAEVNDEKETQFLMRSLKEYIVCCNELNLEEKTKNILDNDRFIDKSDTSNLLLLSGIYLEIIKDYKTSIKYAKEILDIKPSEVKAYNILIKCYKELKDEDKSIWYKRKLNQLNVNSKVINKNKTHCEIIKLLGKK